MTFYNFSTAQENAQAAWLLQCDPEEAVKTEMGEFSAAEMGIVLQDSCHGEHGMNKQPWVPKDFRLLGILEHHPEGLLDADQLIMLHPSISRSIWVILVEPTSMTAVTPFCSVVARAINKFKNVVVLYEGPSSSLGF